MNLSEVVCKYNKIQQWIDLFFHTQRAFSYSHTTSIVLTVNDKMELYMQYTGCPRRNVPDFGRVLLMLKCTDITQNTYVQSWTVMEIMAREKCGLLAGPRTAPVSWQSYPFPSLSVVSHDGNSAHASHWTALQGDM